MTGVLLGVAFLGGMILGNWGVCVAVFVAMFLWRVRQWSLPIAVFLVLFAVFGNVRAIDAPNDSHVQRRELDAIGVVISEPSTTRTGQRLTMKVATDPEPITVCVTTIDQSLISHGDAIRITGEVRPLDDLSNGSRSALLAIGCQATIDPDQIVVIERADGVQSLFNDVRSRVSAFFQQVAPGDTGALMTGLMIGDDSALTYESQEAFLETGTTHITAVSGANFAILVTVASMVAGTVGARRRWTWIVAVSVSIWTYALLVGLPPSAVRAALMATMALIAARFGRIPDFLTLLMFSIVLQLAVRPADLHTLSFQLSASATLALILVFSRWRWGRRGWPLAIVLGALAAHIATIPVLAWQLGALQVLSVPANSAISPFVIAAFPITAAAGFVGLFSGSLGAVVVLPASYLSIAILKLVNWFDATGSHMMLGGDLPGGLIILLTIGCWSIIAILSFDCRVMAAEMTANFGGFPRIWRRGR